MKQLRRFPQVVVTRKAARALRVGHPWVFEGEVRALLPAPSDGRAAANGDVVDVMEENGTYQGTGLLSQESKIRVRVVSRNANDQFDEAFWRRKIAWAWEYRKTVLLGRSLPGKAPDTSCCRVLFSEADGFPGLIVDRYADVLVAQVGTVGMERLRPVLFPLLLEVLRDAGEDVSAIYERSDAPVRAKEGLELREGWWQEPGAATQPRAGRAIIEENGIRYDVDFENSQKTGFFLDQKYNRRAVARLAGGKRVLDCFCHVGTFGLNAAAAGASFVRCVDVSELACELGRANARLNGLSVQDPADPAATGAAHVGFSCANVLEYLPALRADKALLRAEGGPFDLIVLDPPAFTKSRGTADHAAHGYQQINYEALRLLPRGGYLATCSCSHFMPTERLAHVVAEAAARAGVQLRQVEARQQAPDHPILIGVPETDYLKFFIYQVV